MPADDADDDVGGFGQPLPPDDRLWRHPSELFAVQTGAGAAPAAAFPAAPRGGRWVTTTLAGLTGAVLATAILAATGTIWSERVTAPGVIERVAMAPVVSAPIVAGDRKVVEVADRLAPSLARVEVGGGERIGSAVAFRDDGHLLTSSSLLDGAETVDVVVGNTRAQATLVGEDPATGIAVLRLAEGTQMPAAILGDASSLQVGEPTVAVWAPATGTTQPMVATGVVAGLNQRVDGLGDEPLFGMVQVDAALEASALGGPIVDSRGALIGIAHPADADGAFGYAVPIDVARRVGADLIDDGEAWHCWLGIEGLDLGGEQAAELGVAGGAVVQRVLDDSPAAEARLADGDVLVRLGDAPIGSMDDLIGLLRATSDGERVVLHVIRNGHVIERPVVLTTRDE